MTPIKVIDLFAGPGGLGEGFSSFRTKAGQQAFKIAVSIEKEASAHRTLTLRALFRQFADGAAPDAYYAILRGELGQSPEDHFYRLPEVQSELEQAKLEAQAMELGRASNASVYKKVREALLGDEFILIGGPPCQAYSLVGRARNAGEKTKAYDPDMDQRNFLYREYLKIIAKFQPVVFVMENVKGMLSARTSAGPVFPKIHADLTDPTKKSGVPPDKGRSRHKYQLFSFVAHAQPDVFSSTGITPLEPRDFVIKAENHGVPQARHRVIILGVRDDIANVLTPPNLLIPESYRTVKDAISDLPALRSGLSQQADDEAAWARIPSQTIRKLKSFRSTIPVQVAKQIFDKRPDLNDTASTGSNFGLRTDYETMPNSLRQWFRDARMKGYITNHSARGHMLEDLGRYWFAATYRAAVGKSPTAPHFPEPLWPAHANFGSGKFADRFRVQGWDSPSTTVTSHISKDGNYFIHPDPSQMRSLTVREAARLQTFPDNYHFVGNRTQQYVQVGNAVPPLLANKLASVVHEIIGTL